MMKESIKRLKEKLDQSCTGHLPLSLRVDLMKQIGDILSVQKILCECCKKACSFIGRQNKDNVQLLSRINDYLYRKKESVEDILKETEKLRLHVENNPTETDTFVNWAIVMLGYTVYYNTAYMLEIEDYRGEDDGDFDPESWSPDFIGSAAYSGGSPFAQGDEGDTEKRREYWNWYLDMVLSIYENPMKEVIPFHTGSNKMIYIPVPSECDKVLSDKIKRLNSALASYIHAPTDKKETDRMKIYVEDSELVRIVADVIQEYSCIPSTPSKKENYRITGIYNYDIVKFWYCVALLAQSSDACAIACLSELAHTLMEQGPGDLHVLYRILLLLPEQEHLHRLNQEFASYYQKIIPGLESTKWLAKAGIPYPDIFEWSISFYFTSNGEMFFMPEHEAERKAWFILSVELFGPQTVYGDYTRFTSFRIHVSNRDNTIHGQWNEKDGYLLHDREWLMMDEHYTPEQLVILMHRLSGFDIRFSKVPTRIYASKGISRNAIQEWIRNEMVAYEHDQMEEICNQALGILKNEGDIGDTLNEIREKWCEGIPILKDKRFDEVVTQYSCFSHEMGIAALGQELSAYGYALYDLDGDEIYLLALLPQAEMSAFEEKCRKYGQYCSLLKQSRYDFGMKARAIKLRKQMPRERMEWPDDGITYITRGFAGYFAYGEWRPNNVDEWQGTFVVDLRMTPLQPVKLKMKRIHSFIYSEELDFYAALYSTSWGEMPIGGKNPLEAEKWPRMCDLSVEGRYEFRWCGRYLCLGDVHSTIVHTMTERGVRYVSRIMLPEGMKYAPSFSTDGKGMLYIIMGEYSWSRIIRYDDKGNYTMMPFSMSDYDTFRDGSIPVPNTTHILLLRQYTARGNSGIWLESGLLDLDMATQRCRIAPLHTGDGSFNLREFHKEWVLVESDLNGNRTDYARLWNRKTNEVMRLRPGVLGNELFKSLHALPDGTIIVNTLDDVGDVLCRAEDFWNFLCTTSRPRKMGYWLNYPNPYPDTDYELPPLSEDTSLMLAPPFTESSSVHSPAKKTRPAGNNKDGSTEITDTRGSEGIEITEGLLKINGRQVSLPLSYTAMVHIFGKERIIFTHRTMQDDKSKTVQYDKRGFLVWDNAGVSAVRNEENAYNISAIYLWVTENKESVRNLPAPTGVFCGEIVVEGIRWNRKSGMAIRSGELEIMTSASEGYMEITFANSRDRKYTWQHYRDAMVENMQAAFMERKRLVNKPFGQQPEEAFTSAETCEIFLSHVVRALEAGYSMGRSVRYLKTSLLLPLTEAAIKCSEYGSVKASDMLSVYSGCVLLGYEKLNMKRFCETMAKKGIRDFVFDTLIRCCVPDWEVTEYTVFPKIKKWISSQVESGSITEAKAALKNISCISENILITDALITSTLKI